MVECRHIGFDSGFQPIGENDPHRELEVPADVDPPFPFGIAHGSNLYLPKAWDNGA